MNIDNTINNNSVIHIYSQHKQYFIDYLNKHHPDNCLYISDYDTSTSININNFKIDIDELNESLFITKNVFKLNKSEKSIYDSLVENKINSFIRDKIRREKYSIIFYDIINPRSFNFISGAIYNTRVDRIKTIVCFSYKLPPGISDNVDILIN